MTWNDYLETNNAGFLNELKDFLRIPSISALPENTPDVRRAGIRAAIQFGEELLAQPGVRGLNLSSVPEPGRELQMAQDLAEIARAFL